MTRCLEPWTLEKDGFADQPGYGRFKGCDLAGQQIVNNIYYI